MIFSQIESIPVDVEYIRLLYNVYCENIPGYMFRGYTIVGSKISEKPSREIQEYSDAKRPIWFVFSGMGSQWAGMGTRSEILIKISKQNLNTRQLINRI